MTKYRRISKGFVLDLAEKRRKEKNNCMHRCDGHPDSTNNIFHRSKKFSNNSRIWLFSQDYARKALDVLWERRQKGSDLVGTVINIHNGEWVRRGDAVYFSTTFVDSCEWVTVVSANLTDFSSISADSGVGAGIDSYYEYLMKAYILLGDNIFLERFNIVSLCWLYDCMTVLTVLHTFSLSLSQCIFIVCCMENGTVFTVC